MWLFISLLISELSLLSQNKQILIDNITVNLDTILLDEDSIIYINKNDLLTFDLGSKNSQPTLKIFYLKGMQSNWSDSTYQNSVSYSNLNPSEYTFFVKTNQLAEKVNIKVRSHYWLWFLLALILLIALIFVVRGSLRKHINNRIDIYKKALGVNFFKTDQSRVDNILTKQQSSKRKYNKVTVLFADIQGFTKIVEHLNPETLIDELDRFFIRFDEVVEKYRIEKIKTIGDAYMCAGGIPDKNSTNPIEVILAALEMQKFMKQANIDDKKEVGDFWEVRIGVHTGPVISGTIGRKKLSFDIWGDSVNIASRMESSGIAGKINISGVTYELVKDFFDCEYRGKMPIKYKGETDMYFVTRIKKELSIDGLGIIPNSKFITKIKWIQYIDIEENILDLLENKLSKNLHYHSVFHTIDVCTQVEIIGRAEGLSMDELLIVKIAALFHDVGFINVIDNHEEESVKIAQEILPNFRYSVEEVEQICNLIMVTKQNTTPTTLCEKVLKDADLDYLGRADFIPISDRLWKEICVCHTKMSLNEWHEYQLEFLKTHRYYTKTAQDLRQVKKEKQIKKLVDLITDKNN